MLFPDLPEQRRDADRARARRDAAAGDCVESLLMIFGALIISLPDRRAARLARMWQIEGSSWVVVAVPH